MQLELLLFLGGKGSSFVEEALTAPVPNRRLRRWGTASWSNKVGRQGAFVMKKGRKTYNVYAVNVGEVLEANLQMVI